MHQTAFSSASETDTPYDYESTTSRLVTYRDLWAELGCRSTVYVYCCWSYYRSESFAYFCRFLLRCV